MPPSQSIFVGTPVLLVVDIQRGGGDPADRSGIPIMAGFDRVVANAERIVAAAREAGLPVIFFQEVHRPGGIDFGRELDGDEGVHCVEGAPGTELWPTLQPEEGEYHIAKRRYSGFFGTELDLLLKALGATTVVLIGALTDVCVHYTFVDAHQRDFYARVIDDCVIGSSLARHDAALDAMEYLQHGARRSTEEIVSACAVRHGAAIAVGAGR